MPPIAGPAWTAGPRRPSCRSVATARRKPRWTRSCRQHSHRTRAASCTARIDRVLAAPSSLTSSRTGVLGRPDIRLLLAVQVCVLGPLRGAVTQLEGGQRTGNNAGQSYQQAPAGRPASQIASQQGMCSLDGRCLIEHHDDQRFRWSEPMWSPPPESNRRPHPYHGSAAKRCANPRSRRSQRTVDAAVMGSVAGLGAPHACLLRVLSASGSFL